MALEHVEEGLASWKRERRIMSRRARHSCYPKRWVHRRYPIPTRTIVRYKRSKGISLRLLKLIFEETNIDPFTTAIVLKVAKEYLHPKKVKS